MKILTAAPAEFDRNLVGREKYISVQKTFFIRTKGNMAVKIHGINGNPLMSAA